MMHIKAIRCMQGWDEKPTSEAEEGGQKISHALVGYAFTGDLSGESKLDYSMFYSSPAEAEFIGFEQVRAELAEKKGTFVLRHEGTFANGAASAQVEVVAGSGTGDFAGIKGAGRIETDASNPMNTLLDLDIEMP